jgi:hypothetical protein
MGTKVRVGHAVVFPHMAELPTSLGPAGVPQISLAKPQLQSVENAVLDCIRHWELKAGLSPDDVEQIIELLAPTVSLPLKLSSESADAEERLLTLTAEQIEAFSGLRATRGGLILGGAGTGKTVLAIARAQQLAKDGFRTLLVCYNELLGDDLAGRAERPPNLTACTFHTLCLREARRAGLEVQADRPAEWWAEMAPTLLIEASAINETNYDAVVVDEGQDFSPLWLDALRCLISNEPDAPFFILGDPLQDMWGRDWREGAGQPFVWELTRNMRNTQPIARCVAAAIGHAPKSRSVPGPAPQWHLTNGPPREGDVVDAVERLIDQGFGPTSLVVLCASGHLASRLRERSIGPFSFGSWGGRGIATETVGRFKGLESQAIVLALSGKSANEDRTAAYVGMSRARSVLVVVGSKADQTFLNWEPQKQ